MKLSVPFVERFTVQAKEANAIRRSMANAIASPTELGELFICYLVIHLATLWWANPLTAEEHETCRILSATIQWGALLLFASILSTQSLRWQLEESYAGHLLTLVSPGTWTAGNFLAVLQACTIQLAFHLVIIASDAALNGQLSIVPPIHWAIYAVNGIMTLACVIAVGMSWAIWLPKSSQPIYVIAILASWLNVVKEPLSLILPPIGILEAKGLLASEGTQASVTTDLAPWFLSLLIAVTYSGLALSALKKRRIFRMLRA
jgi:hypothetical protein